MPDKLLVLISAQIIETKKEERSNSKEVIQDQI